MEKRWCNCCLFFKLNFSKRPKSATNTFLRKTTVFYAICCIFGDMKFCCIKLPLTKSHAGWRIPPPPFSNMAENNYLITCKLKRNATVIKLAMVESFSNADFCFNVFLLSRAIWSTWDSRSFNWTVHVWFSKHHFLQKLWKFRNCSM